MLAITALGWLAPDAGAIRRGDGRPGDWLVSSGPHGLSRLGLALLQAELPAPAAEGLPGNLRERAIAAHQRPVPRFDAVRALQSSHSPATGEWRVAGTDSSDGLAAAAGAIAAASGCQALLDAKALPLDPPMAALPQAEAWCLAGGEDFELVLALEPTWAQHWLAALPSASRIGTLVAGQAGLVCWQHSGEPLANLAEGFTHFH